MDDLTTKRFDGIAKRVMEDCDRVRVPLPISLDGYKYVREALDERIGCLEEEVAALPAEEREAEIHVKKGEDHPALG